MRYLALLLLLFTPAMGQRSVVVTGHSRVSGGVELGIKPSLGATYLDTGFEDSSLSGFVSTCRQNEVGGPQNTACNETTNLSPAIDGTVAYEGSKSVVCEGNVDGLTGGSVWMWRCDLTYTFTSPKNPAVTDGALWYGFAFRINQDALTCIGTGSTQFNQLKLSLARATDGTGGWSMPIFGRLNGPTANGDDLNFNADGFGTAIIPIADDPSSNQHLFDMTADTWYRVKMMLTRDTVNNRGTVKLWYDSGGGTWKLSEWKTASDVTIESPNDQHTNSNHGWSSEALAQTLRFVWTTSETNGAGGDCVGRTGKVWVDKVWAANYDKY